MAKYVQSHIVHEIQTHILHMIQHCIKCLCIVKRWNWMYLESVRHKVRVMAVYIQW
jgi:hypothetical protein